MVTQRPDLKPFGIEDIDAQTWRTGSIAGQSDTQMPTRVERQKDGQLIFWFLLTVGPGWIAAPTQPFRIPHDLMAAPYRDQTGESVKEEKR